jgi:hypothetical protein
LSFFPSFNSSFAHRSFFLFNLFVRSPAWNLSGSKKGRKEAQEVGKEGRICDTDKWNRMVTQEEDVQG